MNLGQKVRVRETFPPGHVRTPFYLRGKTGEIERELGPFSNPEHLAYRQEASKLKLLRVRFSMGEIWGDDAENPTDTLDAEIYAHWLTPLEDR